MNNRDIEEQKIRDMPNLHMDDDRCTPLPSRPTRNQRDMCFLCKKESSPESIKESFTMGQNNHWLKKMPKASPESWRDKIVEDRLVTCGGGHRGSNDGCNHKFHLSCMMYYRPIARYNSQYLCLEKIMGNLFCHDHVCESCVTDSFVRSSHHGDLIKDISLVRAYHKNCQPAGSITIKKDGETFFKIAKRKKFNGKHLPFCYGCDGTVTGGLTECKTCVQSFHKKCNLSHRVRSTEVKKKCEDCMFQIQKRVDDGVLVEVEDVFRAARILKKEPEKTGKVVVQLLFNEQEIVVDHNTLFRPYGGYVESLLLAMQNINMYSSNSDELKFVEEIFRERKNFSPPNPPLPAYTNDYGFHPSVRSYLPEQRLIVRNETHPDTKIDDSPGLGKGMFITKEIPKDTIIGEYGGEIISMAESKRRFELGDAIRDQQCGFYCFHTTFKPTKGRVVNLQIDGAVIGNPTRMLNHSCRPNCRAVPTPVKVEGGVLEILVFKTNTALKPGTELTIKYNWPEGSFTCLCKECKRKRAKEEQTRERIRDENENDENGQENEGTEGSNKGKKNVGKRGVARKQRKRN
ncbi:unnamed protein product [Caenorhabditis brenneri]